MKRIELRLPDTLVKQLEQLKELHHRSMNSEIIVALEYYVDVQVGRLR